ncbi:MAG: flagellar hook capping FlgD N-terminal domain-containing protein, partial [Paracoccaceae bacterium]|nr:flagellar hook capping FlgD N-terminal domain-containing protein [Paracoccaceae bacterium]
MEPITTPPPLFGAGTAQTQTTQSNSGTTLSSDFETFLKMLTAQMQNQDPLNPVDSTDYATQLATFSSVEQQVLTNDLLRDLGASMGGNLMSELGNWVGMEALVRA